MSTKLIPIITSRIGFQFCLQTLYQFLQKSANFIHLRIFKVEEQQQFEQFGVGSYSCESKICGRHWFFGSGTNWQLYGQMFGVDVKSHLHNYVNTFLTIRNYLIIPICVLPCIFFCQVRLHQDLVVFERYVSYVNM